MFGINLSLIFSNFLSWAIEVQPLKIIYKSENKCNNVQAIDAFVNLSLNEGRYFQFMNTRKKIKCWLPLNNEDRSYKVLNGKALKP